MSEKRFLQDHRDDIVRFSDLVTLLINDEDTINIPIDPVTHAMQAPDELAQEDQDPKELEAFLEVAIDNLDSMKMELAQYENETWPTNFPQSATDIRFTSGVYRVVTKQSVDDRQVDIVEIHLENIARPVANSVKRHAVAVYSEETTILELVSVLFVDTKPINIVYGMEIGELSNLDKLASIFGKDITIIANLISAPLHIKAIQRHLKYLREKYVTEENRDTLEELFTKLEDRALINTRSDIASLRHEFSMPTPEKLHEMIAVLTGLQ